MDPAIPMLEHFAELVRQPELTLFIPNEESMAVARILDAAALSASAGKRISLLEQARPGRLQWQSGRVMSRNKHFGVALASLAHV